MKTILIFGANGFTGGRLVQAARRAGWQVIASGRAHAGIPDYAPVDITDGEAVSRLIEEVRPAAVINAAAMAGIDQVEKHREAAYQVNTIGAAQVARSCQALEARHIFFSSDAVFDGSAEGYAEDAPANPLNYYGVTKAAAERQVMALSPGAVIVRVSLILGYPVAGGNSYLAGTRRRLEAGEEILAPRDEIRTPVDIHTLCAAALELADGLFSGILHIGAMEIINRYDLTCHIATRLGFDTARIIPATLPPDRALRHKNGVLRVQLAQRVLRTPMLSLEQTLERAFLDEFFPTDKKCDKL